MDPVIAHAIDGRLRIRVPAIRGDAAAAATLADRLRRVPGVRHVEASRLTGSVVVRHDASAAAAVWDGLRAALPGLRDRGASPAGGRAGDRPRAEATGTADPRPGWIPGEAGDVAADATEQAARAASGWAAAARAAATRVGRTAREADPATTLAAMFALLGLVDLAARGVRARRVPLPNWYELLWWSFSAYFALQGAASRRAASERPAGVDGPAPPPPPARADDAPPPLRWLPAPGSPGSPGTPRTPGARGPRRP